MVSSSPRPHVSGVALSVLGSAHALTIVNGSDDNTLVTGITHDSRQVRPGDLYAALPGFNTHGANFVQMAVDSGAVAILTDELGLGAARDIGVPILLSEDPRAQLGVLSDEIYEHPSGELTVIGITGTNGKTTTSYLLDAALRSAGLTTGVIGTVGTRIGEDLIATTRTTPEATEVHALLAVMRQQGVTAVSMEVSSHALRLGRVDGVQFASVCFTNLTEDHLDFHHDMEDYFDAKASLFTTDRAVRALVCSDDHWGSRLADVCHDRGLAVQTFGVGPSAQVRVKTITAIPAGSKSVVNLPSGDEIELTVHLPGEFNVVNAVGALVCAISVGVDPGVAAEGISACGGVPGRMERILDPRGSAGVIALVDYAHTPDAVERAISAVRAGSHGQIITVLGAGGDRDRAKRPLMGQAAASLADTVIVTDDNPRSESPQSIRQAIIEGASSVAGAIVLEVADRQSAIAHAVQLAAPGDVILVLGKGHEQGQEVNGVSTPFDDRLVLAQQLTAAAGQPVNPGGGL